MRSSRHVSGDARVTPAIVASMFRLGRSAYLHSCFKMVIQLLALGGAWHTGIHGSVSTPQAILPIKPETLARIQSSLLALQPLHQDSTVPVHVIKISALHQFAFSRRCELLGLTSLCFRVIQLYSLSACEPAERKKVQPRSASGPRRRLMT